MGLQMRIVLLFIILIFAAGAASAQTPAIACPSGSAVSSQIVNTGQSCSPTAIPTGTYVAQTGLTNSLAGQTICDTSATCPAGFYTLFVYVNITTAGTLVSALTSNITFTDDARSNTIALGANLSLIGTTPASYIYSFYHAANTAVTVSTTAVSFTGSPVYNFRARLVWQGS